MTYSDFQSLMPYFAMLLMFTIMAYSDRWGDWKKGKDK